MADALNTNGFIWSQLSSFQLVYEQKVVEKRAQDSTRTYITSNANGNPNNLIYCASLNYSGSVQDDFSGNFIVSGDTHIIRYNTNTEFKLGRDDTGIYIEGFSGNGAINWAIVLFIFSPQS